MKQIPPLRWGMTNKGAGMATNGRRDCERWGVNDILGGMAYEAESDLVQRLQRSYAEMSDGELVGLAEKPGDLTESAQEVLRTEMAKRGLQAPEPVQPIRWEAETRPRDRWAATSISPILGAEPELDATPLEDSRLGTDDSLLGTFHDAIEVGRACEFLEQAEVEFRVQDISKPSNGMGVFDSPPVALNLIVAKDDRERAMRVLRKAMGLFPLQEVEEADAMVDDGTVTPVGYFASRMDADHITEVLDAAHVWNRISANPEGSAENEDLWMVEVREVDLMKAGNVVEKALG